MALMQGVGIYYWAGMQDEAPKTPKQLRYEAKKLEMVRGAARVFARLGYRGASLNDVADELGTTAAALYHYVKSKDELLLEANIIAADRLKQIFAAIERDGSKSPLEQLIAFFRNYADLLSDDFGRCLALTTPYDLPSPYREASLELRRDLTNMVRQLIRKGIAEGSIQPCDDRLLAFMLYGSTNTMARWFPNDKARTATDSMDAMLTMLINGLVHPPSFPMPAKSKYPAQ